MRTMELLSFHLLLILTVQFSESALDVINHFSVKHVQNVRQRLYERNLDVIYPYKQKLDFR